MSQLHGRLESSPVLVTGAARALERRDLDLHDREAVEAVIERYRAWAVVDAAGYVRVGEEDGRQLGSLPTLAVTAANVGEARRRRRDHYG